MATYRIEATASLVTSIEPEGYLCVEDVEGFSDDTSYEYTEIRQDLSYSFEIKASDEDDAWNKGRDAAEDVRFDTNDIAWEIEDVEIGNVERISVIPTLAEAVEILRNWFDGESLPDEVSEALLVVLDNVDHLGVTVRDLQAQVDSLKTASVTPFGPAEPESPAPPIADQHMGW